MSSLRLSILAACALLVVRTGGAAEVLANLPPEPAVARLIAAAPEIMAAQAMRDAETAQRERLKAGSYEWVVRLGGQRRRVLPEGASESGFSEWNGALERAVRLPGKAGIDAELGDAGVAQAETALGDARHEFARALLQAWFAWLREGRALRQWQTQEASWQNQAQGVGRRLQLGDAARIESVQIEAALAQASAQRAQAEARVAIAADVLRTRFPGIPLEDQPTLAEPTPLDGSAAEWVARMLEHNHELRLATHETRKAELHAERARSDRLPDPSFGLAYARERAGEERLLGAYVSIPLPGGARSAMADAGRAQAAAAERREAATRRRIEAEAAARYQAAQAAVPAWQAAQQAADRLRQSADMLTRAYSLGEGSLSDLLLARRQANEALVSAETLRLDALEARYRVLLDAHLIWDFD